MAFHGSQHFLIIAVIGSEEVRADKQQDDVVIFNMIADLGVQLLAGPDAAIVPRFDNTLTLEHCQLGLELVAKRFVLVGVRKK